jgi:hypothetical protein
VYVQTQAVRRFRKQVQAGVRSGRYPLRVVGSQAAGFRLGAERGQTVVLFGRSFGKQGEAVAFGLDRLGYKARKLVQGSRKAA